MRHVGWKHFLIAPFLVLAGCGVIYDKHQSALELSLRLQLPASGLRAQTCNAVTILADKASPTNYQFNLDGPGQAYATLADCAYASNPLSALSFPAGASSAVYYYWTTNSSGTETLAVRYRSQTAASITSAPWFHSEFLSDGPDADVFAIKSLSDGKILVAGAFTHWSGAVVGHLLRLNADASVDTSFSPGTGANGTIYALQVASDGAIYIGGSFTSFNGVSSGYLARLHADGTLDTSFQIGSGADAAVRTIYCFSNGTALVGGQMTSYQGTAVPYAFFLNSNGTLDTVRTANLPAFNNWVLSIATQSTGKILVGGLFRLPAFVGGMNGLDRLLADGTQDATWASGIFYIGSLDTYSITVLANDDIMVGTASLFFQEFSPGSVTARGPMYYINADGSQPTTQFTTNYADPLSPMWFFPQSSGGFFVVGFFGHFDWNFWTPVVAKLDAGLVLDPSFSVGNGFSFGSFSNITGGEQVASDKLLITGFFFNFGNFFTNSLALVDLNTGALDPSLQIKTRGSSRSSASGSANVTSITGDSEGNLYIGGGFYGYSGATAGGLVKLDSTGSAIAAFPTTDGFASATYHQTVDRIFLQSDGKILLQAYVQDFGGQTDYSWLVRLNADGTLDTGFKYALVGEPVAALSPSGKIFAGFKRMLDSGAVDTTFDTTGDTGIVRASIAESNGKLTVGGSITQCRGVACGNIGRFNSDGSLDTSFVTGTGFDGAVRALLQDADGSYWVGGAFTHYNGHAISKVAKLKADGTLDTAFSPGSSTTGTVSKLALQPDGKLLVAGTFSSFNGVSCNNLVRLNADGSVDTTFAIGTGPTLLTSGAGTVDALYVQADGKIVVGGMFDFFNGRLVGNVVRLLPDGSFD